MDLVTLVGIYGPLGAAVVGAVVWVAKVYIDKIRPDRIARENRIIAAFEKNTTALIELRASIDHRDKMDTLRTEAQTAAMVEIKDQLRHLAEDVAALFAKLDIPRPSRQRNDNSR